MQRDSKYDKVLHAIKVCTVASTEKNVTELRMGFNKLKEEIDNLDKDEKWYFNAYNKEYIDELESIINLREES